MPEISAETKLKAEMTLAQSSAIVTYPELLIPVIAEAIQEAETRGTEKARQRLVSYFMDYPHDEEGEELNRMIAAAPLEKLVDTLINAHNEAKIKIQTTAITEYDRGYSDATYGHRRGED